MDEHLTKKITIVISGKPYEWDKNSEITYAEVVKLAVPNYNPKNTYSVTYRRGEGNKPEGILPPGSSIKIKNGMIFDVSETAQS